MYRDKNWLYDGYVTNGLSTTKLGEIANVSARTVAKYLKRHGIPVRDMKECHSGSKNGAWIDNPIKDKKLFHDAYISQDLGLGKVAEKFGVSKRTAARWLKKHGITPHEFKAWLSRHPTSQELSPTWKGGIAKCACGEEKSRASVTCRNCHHKKRQAVTAKINPQKAEVLSFVRTWAATNWRPRVFERDNYTCQSCGYDKGGILQAHHIHRLSELVTSLIKGRDIGSPAAWKETSLFIINHKAITDVDNGVTLCKPCHRDLHKGKQTTVMRHTVKRTSNVTRLLPK